MLLIIGFLIGETSLIPAEISLLSFLTDAAWNPTKGEFNMLPMIAGSLAVTVGALLLAYPLGLACAVYHHLYAPRWARVVVRRSLEILGGIPSVVYGFWGLVVLVPVIGKFAPPGAGLLTAALVLALMVIPTIALMIDVAFAAVPEARLNSVRALGLGRWEVLRLSLLPSARLGLLTAGLLATGRAVGETMAVLMVAGNIVQLPDSLFAPVRTLTANIALELGYAEAVHRSVLFVSGLLLVVVVFVLMALAAWAEARWHHD